MPLRRRRPAPPGAPERRRGNDRRRSNRVVRRIAVLLAVAYFGMFAMFLGLWKNSRDAAEAKVADVRIASEANKFAIKHNQRTVAELCRTNGIIRGVMTETIDFRRFLIQSGMIASKAERDRYEMNILIMEGYLEQLDQQTACREVIRP